MPVKAGDYLGTRVLIGPHHLPEVFGIELARQRRRVDQVAEQHGELAPFRLWRRGGGWQRGRQGRGGCKEDRRRRVTRPDQDGPILIGREPLALDKFVSEVVQRGGVQVKLPLERAIRQAAPLAQERNHLIQNR
jgi:hypothetical protein